LPGCPLLPGLQPRRDAPILHGRVVLQLARFSVSASERSMHHGFGAPLRAVPETMGGEVSRSTKVTRDRLRAIAVGSASLALLLGVIVLLADWGIGAVTTRSVMPVVLHMKPLTALGLVMAGVSLLLLVGPPRQRWRRRLAVFPAGAATLLGAAVISEYVFDLRLGFDTLLFPDLVSTLTTTPVPRPGLPAPHSAVAFLLVGGALLGLALREAVRWTHVLALAAGFIATQALIGYAYGAEGLYRISVFSPMTLPSALGFLLVATSLLCIRPERGLAGQLTAPDAGGFVARRLLPVALLVPIVTGFLGLLAVHSDRARLETGVAFVVVSAMFGIAGAVWASTRALSAADRQQNAANAAAQQLSEHFRRALELSPLPMMIHAEDGSILQISRAWRDLSGYDLDEIPTMSDWTRTAYGDDARIAHARAATLFDLDERLAEEGEYNVRTKSGETRIWSFSSAPLGRIPDGRRIVISVAVDMTERTRSERELRSSNERLAFLFNATSRLLASSDPQHLVETLHAELSTMLELDVFLYYTVEEPGAVKPLRLSARAGVTQAQTEQLRWLDYGEAVSGVVARDRRRIVLENVQASRDPMVEAIREAGVRAYVCHPLVARDVLVGTLSFGTRRRSRFLPDELDLLQAVANQVALAMERARAHHSEQRARASAEEASRAKDQFMAVVSHELRTPLTAVVGYTDLLEADVEGTLSPAHRRFVGRIRQSAWSLAAVIDEILTFARTRAGHEKVSWERTDVVRVAVEAVDTVQPEADRKGLCLTAQLPDPPLILHTDPARLRRILLNLLGNAVKFTESGEVALDMGLEQDTLRIAVRDTGLGIPPDFLNRIFDPFIQVDASETRTQSGTGLGLTITRELARLLGGTVAVDSTLGSGSTFTVELPAHHS
jgi:PAS domain S-box-containing protein